MERPRLTDDEVIAIERAEREADGGRVSAFGFMLALGLIYPALAILWWIS